MKQFLTILFSVCFIGTLLSQEERILSAFTELDVSGGIKVDLIPGGHKAEVDVIEARNAELITEVEKGTLKIYFKSKSKTKWNNGNNKANVTLYYQNLNDIDASAGAKISGDDMINSNDMEVEASSGASIKLMIEAGRLEVDASSGSSINLSGKARKQEVSVSSGASYRGSELKSEESEASVSSGASAQVWATDRLEADASSGGSVRYKGEPRDLDLDSGKYSGGSIRKM